MKQLYNLEAAEVSLVPRGANKKKFLIFKAHEGDIMTKEQIDKIAKGDSAVIAKVEQILKAFQEEMKKDGEEGMSDKAQTALKAVARILTPFKDELPPELMKAVMSACGMDMEKDGEEGGDDDGDGDVEKLGENGTKINQAEVLKAKAKKSKAADDADDEEDEDDEEKGEKEMAKKSAETILKADGTLDLSAVPEAVRADVEKLYNSQQEAIKKAGDAEAIIKAQEAEKIEKAFAEKADSFKHLGADKAKVANVLKTLTATSAELGADLEGILKAADEQIAKGELFKEHGSALSGQVGTAWEAIEKAAMEIVAKTGEAITKEQAVAKFLGTDVGQKMYDEYKTKRGGI